MSGPERELIARLRSVAEELPLMKCSLTEEEFDEAMKDWRPAITYWEPDCSPSPGLAALLREAADMIEQDWIVKAVREGRDAD
jgi:hypothetical protein